MPYANIPDEKETKAPLSKLSYHQIHFSGQSLISDGPNGSSLREFLPIRLWRLESAARDTGRQKLHQYVRGARGPAAGDPETCPGGAIEFRRQQRHFEGQDVLQIVHGHPWVQQNKFQTRAFVKKIHVYLCNH